VHHTSVMNLLFSLTASKEFELLCNSLSLRLMDGFMLVYGKHPFVI